MATLIKCIFKISFLLFFASVVSGCGTTSTYVETRSTTEGTLPSAQQLGEIVVVKKTTTILSFPLPILIIDAHAGFGNHSGYRRSSRRCESERCWKQYYNKKYQKDKARFKYEAKARQKRRIYRERYQ